MALLKKENNRREVSLAYKGDDVRIKVALAANDLRRKRGITARVGAVGENHGHKYAGVIPPPLSKRFMTSKLSPHQINGLKEIRYHRRQQLYADGFVHDVDAAISYLRGNIVGFFVAAPLDWGHGTRVKDDPTKATIFDIDIAREVPNRQTEDVTS